MLSKRLDELRLTGNLPSPTGVGLAILEQTSREDYSLGDLARTLQHDPALTGRILRLANSSAKSGSEPAKTVADATMRLGVRTVRSVALGFSLVSGNRAGNCQGFDYEAYWSRALACAVAAQALAERRKDIVPAEAFTCGLLCEIGKLALASIHPATYARLLREGGSLDEDQFAALENREFGIDHRELASALLADWRLPDSFAHAVSNFDRVESEDAPQDEQAKALTAILRGAFRIAAACTVVATDSAAVFRERWHALEDVQRELGFEAAGFATLCDQVRAGWRDWGAILKIPTPSGMSFEELSRVAAERRREDGLADVPNALAARKGLRVLAVDDEPITLKLLVHHLARDGHTVMTATNGRQALAMALEHNPQMVVTDWMMPELDGIDVCRALRRASESVGTYILIVTGREEEERVVEAFDAGVDEYVCKPFNPRVLLARVRAGQRMIELREQVERDRQERARQLAEMAVLNRRLQTAALTDVLTELPNRRYAMKRLEQELESWRASRTPLSVIMIDIDTFKSINDQHGHDTGDSVLRATAGVLRGAVRRGDIVCRLGGEEFLVISPGSDIKRCSVLAERIRRAVEQTVIEHGTFRRNITISAGAATLDPTHPSIDALLKVADERVYRAKQAGRNRVAGEDDGEQRAKAV